MQVIIVAVVDAKDPRWKSGQSKLLLLLLLLLTLKILVGNLV